MNADNFQLEHDLEGLPEILTALEGAAALRCSKAHFCNLLSGKVRDMPRIPSLRLGRRVLVRKRALVEWLEQLEACTTRR